MQYHRKSQEREDKEWRRSDIQTSYTRSNSQRRVYDKARGSLSGQPPRGPQKPGEFTDALADQWQSGRVFQKKGPRGGARRRNDPWWMKEEESNVRLQVAPERIHLRGGHGDGIISARPRRPLSRPHHRCHGQEATSGEKGDENAVASEQTTDRADEACVGREQRKEHPARRAHTACTART